MDRRHLHQRIASMRQSFFDEGILDHQFIVLENLEKDGDFGFVEDVSTIYFRDTVKSCTIIEEEMEKTPFDYDTVETRLHQLKGSSASLGAIRVTNAVNRALKLFYQGNVEGFKASIQRVKTDHEILKAKLETYFQLLNQLE